jgi:hypothetical protein
VEAILESLFATLVSKDTKDRGHEAMSV